MGILGRNDRITLMMLVRKAKPEESKTIASFIFLAMEDIAYTFIGERSPEKAKQWLDSLVRMEGNQYSYKNCWVAISEEEIVAAAVVYDGGRLAELRAPVAAQIKSMFSKSFNPEDETQAGEYYIDSVGVHPERQGEGIGSKVFKFLIDTYVNDQKQTLGLLVDKDNPKAKSLYLKLGFKVVGEKALAGKELEHMQFKT